MYMRNYYLFVFGFVTLIPKKHNFGQIKPISQEGSHMLKCNTNIAPTISTIPASNKTICTFPRVVDHVSNVSNANIITQLLMTICTQLYKV